MFVSFHGCSDSFDTFRGNDSANDDSNGIGGMLGVGRSEISSAIVGVSIGAAISIKWWLLLFTVSELTLWWCESVEVSDGRVCVFERRRWF